MPSTYKVNVRSEKEMSPVEAAYVAGLIDGEGTICLSARKGECRRSHHFLTDMKVANTDLGLLEYLVELTGNGGIWRTTRPAGHKTGYIWRLMPRQIRFVLPQVMPYLFLKRPQAELLMQFFAIQRRGARGDGQGRTQEEDIPEVLAIYEQMRQLNRRGTVLAQDVLFEFTEGKERKRTCNNEGCEQRRYATYDQCYEHWLAGREPIRKTCDFCGISFEAVLDTKRFCSPKCQWRSAYVRRLAQQSKLK